MAMLVRRALAVLTTLCALLALLVVMPLTVGAAPTADFSPRKTFNINGAIALAGNALLTCPASDGCTAAKAGQGGTNLNDNNWVMRNLDRDDVASTFNSSNSQLILPAGSSVQWAGLYWGARLDKGSGGSSAPTNPGRSQMSLRGPNDNTYQSISSSVEFGPNGDDNAYQEFADVTPTVQQQGAGIWWGANVAAGTGEDRYAGWTLVVVYSNPALPLRNLTVFDGFNVITKNNPETITISGFLAPQAGHVQTQLGMVAYEGDLGTTGDSATLSSGSKTTTLATGLSPGNNFFSSANSLNGANVETRDPNDRNMLGFDIKDFGAPDTIPNSATSATITLQSSGDTYYPGVVTTAIDLFAPDFTSSVKTVSDLQGNNPAGPGDTLEYTLNTTNTGSDPARSSVLTDVLPPNTTYVPGSLVIANGPNAGTKTDAAGDDQAEFLAASRTVRFRLGTGANATAGGIVGVNSATAVTFQVTINPGAAGSTVTNQASLAYVAATINQPFTYITNATRTPVVANANLVVSKSAGGPVNAGERSATTITVRNNGPNDADNVQVTDQLPDGVDFVSATPTAGSCSQASGTVTCSLGDLADGATETIRVVVRVPPGSTDGSVTDVASAMSDTNDPNLQNNTAGATADVGTSADLSITKTANPTTVAPGQMISFPITVQNNGPSDARSVTISDSLDSSQLTLISIDHTEVCQGTPSGFNCALPSLAAGGSFTVTLAAMVPPNFTGTSVSNSATVASQTPDPTAGNNNDDVSVTVSGPRADVAISKVADPTTVVAGERTTFTLTVSNPNGPSVAQGVVVDDVMPPGLVAISAVSDGGPCEVRGSVSCILDTLNVGSTATVTVVAVVDQDAPLGSITNTASVRSSGSVDPDQDNNSDSVDVTVTGEADVAITKTGTGGPVAGGPISYTLTATNNGPSRARGVTVSDTLPTSLTDITAPGCSVSGQTVTCTAPDLAVGGSLAFTVNATVIATFPGGAITNTATVDTTGTTDPNPDNDSASFASTASVSADVSVTKAAPATALAGGTVVYNLTVSNAGPSAADSTTVTDPLPTGLTVVSATTDQGSCTPASSVSCDLGTVNPGSTVHITITARVDPGVASASVIANEAAVSSTTPDPTESNNSDRETTTIETAADIRVTKELLTQPPLASGQFLQFRMLVRNDGPSDAATVSMRDSIGSLSAGVVDITIDGTQGFDQCEIDPSGDLFCQLGDLPVGETSEVLLTVIPDPGASLNTRFANDVTVAAVTSDPDHDNNAAEAPFQFTRTEADLDIAKDGAAQLVAGTEFSYTITVDNTTGPSNAADVVVTDTLPAGLTATQALPSQGSCTIAGTVVTCSLGTVLRILQTPVITITGTVDPDAATGVVTNTASVTTSTPDPEQSNNTATFDSTIGTQANLSLTKTADSDPLVAGTEVGYTLTVTNAGPSDASPVTLVDVLPTAVAFDPTKSDPSCVQNATVDCALGNVPAGATRVVRISGQLDPAYAGATLTNTASIDSPVDDPDTSDNTATDVSDVQQQADLSVSKIAEATETPAAGSDLTYDISVVNHGPSDAVNASFTDILPLPPTSFILPSQGDVTCALDGLTVTCTAPRLPAGESRTGQITIHIPADHTAGPMDNPASVTSDTSDPVQANNDVVRQVNVVLVADLKMTKTLLTDPIVAGEPVTYRLTVENQGPSTAPNVLVSDPLANNVTLTGAPPGCDATQGEEHQTILACRLTTLAVGESASATITVTPSPDATGDLTNAATAGADSLDPAPDDNTSTVTAPITSEVDLAVRITGPAKVQAGGTADFHIGYSNRGPSNATDVVITDTLPAGLTVPNPPAGCTISGRTLTCNVGALVAGASGSLDLTVAVDASLKGGARLIQTVTISADQTDVNPDNDTASISSTVGRATDVAVTVTADGPTVMQGGVAGYSVTVTNNGPLPATAVVLKNVLPPEVTNPRDPPDCTFTGSTATCSLGDLAVGASTTIPFRGDVPAGTPVGSKLVDNASVTHDETDSVAVNNQDKATISVVAQASGPPPPTQPPPQGPPPSNGPLPSTGAELLSLILVALILIGAGAGLTLAARARRPSK